MDVDAPLGQRPKHLGGDFRMTPKTGADGGEFDDLIVQVDAPGP